MVCGTAMDGRAFSVEDYYTHNTNYKSFAMFLDFWWSFSLSWATGKDRPLLVKVVGVLCILR